MGGNLFAYLDGIAQRRARAVKLKGADRPAADARKM